MAEQVTIIGGGMAGASAAWHLAQHGRSVSLHEATSGPHHKVCGEFLSAEGYELLSEILGQDLTAKAPPPITTALFTAGRQSVGFELPQTCYGLTRYWIDEAMLGAAAKAGSQVQRGSMLKSLPPGQVVLATGKREHAQAKRSLTGREHLMVGLKQHLSLRRPLPAELKGLIHLFFFAGGYGGIMEVEDNRISLALAVSKDSLATIGTKASDHLRVTAKSDLSLRAWLDCCDLDSETLAIGRVPYGYLHKTYAAEAVYRIGDQAAVIPSYSGDGMSIALASGKWVAEAIQSGQSPEAFNAALASKVSSNVRQAYRFQPLIARPKVLAPMMAAARLSGLAQPLGRWLFAQTRTQI